MNKKLNRYLSKIAALTSQFQLNELKIMQLKRMETRDNTKYGKLLHRKEQLLGQLNATLRPYTRETVRISH